MSSVSTTIRRNTRQRQRRRAGGAPFLRPITLNVSLLLSPILLHVLQVVVVAVVATTSSSHPDDDQTCQSVSQSSLTSSKCTAAAADNNKDPWLRNRTFDIGNGDETALFYLEPDVASFYRKTEGSVTKVTPYYNGFAGKFVNLSSRVVKVFWDSGTEGILMSHINPFDSWGTATYSTHKFYMTPYNDPSLRLASFTMTADSPIKVYDPYDTDKTPQQHETIPFASLSDTQVTLYQRQKRNLFFGEKYHDITGRHWLALHPRRPPRHFMWRPEYLGQEFVVETKETYFETLPPLEELVKGVGRKDRVLRDDQPRLLQEYRTPGATSLNLTLTALSCSPRVFEIKNFLSPLEVKHILHLATGMDLHRSQTDGGTSTGVESTRTSQNTWLHRDRTPLIDAIYRRAADSLRIDESLLRNHPPTDDDDGRSLAEELQLVHYGVGQQYTPHHDFSHPPVEEEQQSGRFATVLFYLNEGMSGGETTFPRWVNGRDRGELKVVPEVGKAVLFYSMLPDGNFDDLSHHAAKKVIKGEKWLTNLWVWDPRKRV